MGVSTGVEPIEGQTAEAFEVVELESWLDDELKCESPHADFECSVEVTHISEDTCGGPTWRVCTAAAEANRAGMEAGGKCDRCLRLARDCWRVRPI